MKNKIILSLALLVAIFAVVLNFGDSKHIDIVAREAVKSFGEVLTAYPKTENDGNGNFWFVSPGGKEKFFWGERVGVEFDVEPFLNSGLDPAKLPPNFRVEGDKLVISIENAKFKKNSDPAGAFASFVENNRDSIGYHSSLGHFGVALKVSHFEWAKDIGKNDKDIVFMLNPALLAPAGLDPKKLDGWVVAKVEIMDGNKVFEAERLLKFYDVK